MTGLAGTPADAAIDDPMDEGMADARQRLPSGWRIVAAKEFADHLSSVRLYVLFLVLGAAALIPMYFAAERIRSLAGAASGAQAVFLALFWLSPRT